ncbi:MAG: enoyl-CoA hydratase/isomerase family protein [Deltaproteobacteria bacterium]|nr:enoyl-CoA hydratase/isomerase family protein [Deltaproteobacteria bacterium]
METLAYRTEGRIGFLTLQRPEQYNAVDRTMMAELESFWRERQWDDSVGVLVLDGGTAKGFCAGLDMRTFGPEIFALDTAAMYDGQRRLARLLLAMRRVPQPIVCAVHGAAAGLGFSFAMASDVRVVAEDARFSAAYINIGLGGADMASSYFLPRQIGAGRAYEFLLTGNWMSAADAGALGFASRVVPRDRLLPTALELAQTIAAKNPLGVRMTKEALNVSLDAGGLEACLELEDRNQTLLMLAKKAEGGMAFRQ